MVFTRIIKIFSDLKTCLAIKTNLLIVKKTLSSSLTQKNQTEDATFATPLFGFFR